MSEATSTSAGTLSGDPLENLFRPSAAMVSGDIEYSSPMPTLTQYLPFSSGNPRIEETRGVMHLYKDDAASSSSELPVSLNSPSSFNLNLCTWLMISVQLLILDTIWKVQSLEDSMDIFFRLGFPRI